jgi:arsenate reductase-like glutaredoxin family protein
VIELLLERDEFEWSPSQAPAPAATVGKAAAAAAELMQRPVIIRGERAVIARPSDKVLELLD